MKSGKSWADVIELSMGTLRKVCSLSFLSAALRLRREGCSVPLGVGRAPLTGGLHDLRQERREGRTLLTPAGSHFFSLKVPYSGVTCPEPRQKQLAIPYTFLLCHSI